MTLSLGSYQSAEYVLSRKHFEFIKY